jgi:hypothetical protein
MIGGLVRRIVSSFAICVLCSGALFAQKESLPRFGIGVRASTLGIGVEAATAVTRKSNFRAGFNTFSYTYDFNNDGIDYSANLSLRSVELHYDQYLIGGFHVSPGVLIYDDNHASATATASSGVSITLGDERYYSSASNPITGTGTLKFPRKVAPELLFGFGNLLPRSRHFAINFEFGAVYQGSPTVKLNLAGNACSTNPNVGCQPIATDPSIQANIVKQQNKVNHDIRVAKFWPVIALGIGYKF